MNVRFTLPALADLEDILDYIASKSPQGVARVQARIQTLVELLAQHPRMGAATDDPTIRRLTLSPYPYLLFYEPSDEEIIVHALRHAARDPGTMPGAKQG